MYFNTQKKTATCIPPYVTCIYISTGRLLIKLFLYIKNNIKHTSMFLLYVTRDYAKSESSHLLAPPGGHSSKGHTSPNRASTPVQEEVVTLEPGTHP